MKNDVWVYYCKSCHWCSDININKTKNLCPKCGEEGNVIQFIGNADKIGNVVKYMLLRYGR